MYLKHLQQKTERKYNSFSENKYNVIFSFGLFQSKCQFMDYRVTSWS